MTRESGNSGFQGVQNSYLPTSNHSYLTQMCKFVAENIKMYYFIFDKIYREKYSLYILTNLSNTLLLFLMYVQNVRSHRQTFVDILLGNINSLPLYALKFCGCGP